MSLTEKTCRWAYAKAMQIESVRKSLAEFGRAIYLEDGSDSDMVLPSGQRFVLSRVEMSTPGFAPHSLVYCNGVCVA